jgi:hypothetical protein
MTVTRLHLNKAACGFVSQPLKFTLPMFPATSPAGTAADSLGQLGLSRDALLAAGLPQHTINALYRAMAAHAGAQDSCEVTSNN